MLCIGQTDIFGRKKVSIGETDVWGRQTLFGRQSSFGWVCVFFGQLCLKERWTFRVANTQQKPYLYLAISAKETYNLRPFPQKSPILNSSVAERDLQLQASCAPLPLCSCVFKFLASTSYSEERFDWEKRCALKKRSARQELRIALLPNTRVVKCKYHVSQKCNESNDDVQWYHILLSLIF